MQKGGHIFFTLGMMLLVGVLIGGGCKISLNNPENEMAVKVQTSSSLNEFLNIYKNNSTTINPTKQTDLVRLFDINFKTPATGNWEYALSFYTQKDWNDGKTHTFYIVWANDAPTPDSEKYFGPFSGDIKKLLEEAKQLKAGQKVGSGETGVIMSVEQF
jgi:hypothetical protein